LGRKARKLRTFYDICARVKQAATQDVAPHNYMGVAGKRRPAMNEQGGFSGLDRAARRAYVRAP
jgi:hypothetical protein